MAKDEIAKQIEELNKYLKEQQRQELLKERQKASASRDSALSDDNLDGENDYYDEDDFEEAEIVQETPEAFPGSNSENFGQADANPSGKKNGCGCGCFSFVIGIIIFGMIISIIFNIAKRSGKINYSKSVSVQSSSGARNIQDTAAALQAKPRYHDFNEIIAAIAMHGDENLLDEVFTLASQREEIENTLVTKFESEKYLYDLNLPENVRKMEFSSSAKKYEYFLQLYNYAMSHKAQYTEQEKEAIEFYRNYSAVESTYDEINEKLNHYMDQYGKQ